MIRKIANDYYMNQNYNCGECILLSLIHISEPTRP